MAQDCSAHGPMKFSIILSYIQYYLLFLLSLYVFFISPWSWLTGENVNFVSASLLCDVTSLLSPLDWVLGGY